MSPLSFEPEQQPEPTLRQRRANPGDLALVRARAGVIVLNEAASKAAELGLFDDQNEAVVAYLRTMAADLVRAFRLEVAR
jgi:hypothetical protein